MTKLTIDMKGLGAQLKKQQKELEKQAKRSEMQTRASTVVSNQPLMGTFRKMDQGSEDAFRVIMKKYCAENQMTLCVQTSDFPEYLSRTLSETFEKLKLYGVLASYQHYVTFAHVTLMPQANAYFRERDQFERRDITMFVKLPSNSKQLMNDILQAENPTKYLCTRFEECESERDDEVLRSLVRELVEGGYINIPGWAENAPEYVEINNLARTYKEREAEFERQMNLQSSTVFNIGTINANGSNLVLGDVNNSTLFISKAIEQIKTEIEEKGGAEKKELFALLDEVTDIVENIKATRAIPKNKSFCSRLSNHLAKHGWFYSEVIGLLGTAAMMLMQG